MMEEILKRIILENMDMIGEKKLIKRDFPIPGTENIKVLTGIRRCGKTHQLFQKIHSFDPERVLFIDFEDERLIQLGFLGNYDVIIDTYKRLYPDHKPVLFFDEIQSLPNWHLYLKRLFAQGFDIFVTGSNANLLSSEISTFLKGRAIETHIFPFSFKEFLLLKNMEFTEKDYYTSTHIILNLFDEYLKFGGFPEVIKAPDADKRAVVRSIHELILYKDLASKYEKNDFLFQLIISKLVENVGKAFSLNKLANKIIPIYKTSNPTVTDYVHLLSMPFVAKPVFMYRKSFVQREMERKIYFQDNSFITQNTLETDFSRLMENCCFIHFDRYFDDVFYYVTNNKLEVDFVCRRENVLSAYQVSYTMADPETRERETKALIKCAKELQLKEATIITYNETGSEQINGIQINIIPIWRFLLQG